jgi:hypothetical protein
MLHNKLPYKDALCEETYHWLFLQAHPAPSIFVLLFCLNASGRFSNVVSMAICRIPVESFSIFRHPTQVHMPGEQALLFWKQVQYSLRHLDLMQLQACSPGGNLLAELLPALVKARGFLVRIDWIA